MSIADPRPTTPDRVRLRVGEYETLAPVIATDESAVHLQLDDVASGAGEIVFSHPRGVISLTGTVTTAGEVAVFTVGETKRLEQRRGAFRLTVACPVHVVRADGTRLDYRTGDLSLTGVRILDADELEDGEHLRVEIELDQLGVAEADGEVVRRDDLSIGVAFGGMSAETEHRLGAFIAEVQRRRLRPAAA